MRNRRTVRDFDRGGVDDASVENILAAGTLPPSGADKQPFVYIVVKNPGMRAEIRKRAEEAEALYHNSLTGELKEWFKEKNIDYSKPFLTDAPVLLVVAADMTKPYWRESAWISITYTILAIESEGLGTVTYTPSDPRFLNEVLKIPDNYSPEVILPIGRSAKQLPPKKERPAGRVFAETFGR